MAWDDTPPDSTVGIPTSAGGSWDSMPPDSQGMTGQLPPQSNMLSSLIDSINKSKLNPQPGLIEQGLMKLGVDPAKIGAFNQVSNLAPWNLASNVMPQIAGNTAERMSQGINIPGVGNIGVSPSVSAQTMTPLAALPSLTAAASVVPGAADAILRLSRAGQAMGQVEKAAGIVDRVPPFRPTPSNLGQTLAALEDVIPGSLKGATKQFLSPKLFEGSNVIGAGTQEATGLTEGGTITDPQTAKDALNLLKDIRDNPKLYGMSKVAKTQIDRLWPQAQQLVSTLVDNVNAEAIRAGTLPARMDLVPQAAKYFKILSPIKTAGAIAAALAGSPTKAGMTSFTANQVVNLFKKIGGH